MKILNFLDIFDNKIVWQILRCFVRNRSAFTGRHLAQLVGVNNVTVTSYLEKLVEEGVLEKSVAGKSYLYRIRSSHIVEKIILPLIESEQKIYSDVKKILTMRFRSDCVGLAIYGSYATQRETAKSDLDICFLVYKKTKHVLQKIDKYAEEFREKYGLVLEPYILTVREFQSKQNLEVVKSIVQNGVWLIGDSKVLLRMI